MLEDVACSHYLNIHFFPPLKFVPFREYIGGIASGNSQLSQARLAKDVLAEVPDQLISFMKRRNIIPKDNPPASHQPLSQALPSAPPV